MPPKSTRNMGSLAQNSAEANNNKSKRGMLASTKNLFSTRKLSGNTSTASKASSGSRTERNMAQSVQPNNPSSKSSVATGRQTAPGGMLGIQFLPISAAREIVWKYPREY